MKTVSEIFRLAGISSSSVFDSDIASRLYDIGVLTGLWYGGVLTLREYRAARSAVLIIHYGMID